MKTFKIRTIPALFGLMAILFQACTGTTGDRSSTVADEDIIKQEVILSPESQAMMNRFPSPFEAMELIRSTGAPYLLRLSNDPANVTRYFTQKSRSVNLGIYSVDLAYASLYHKVDETEQFYYCTGKLADDLGIAGIYDRSLPERAGRAMDDRDSLARLIRELFTTSSDFLRRNNRNQVAVLVAAGSLTESLYISISLCQMVKENAPVVDVISRQKENLEMLLHIMAEYGDDVNIKPVAEGISALQQLYAPGKITRGRALAPAEVTSLLKIIEPVRTAMIK